MRLIPLLITLFFLKGGYQINLKLSEQSDGKVAIAIQEGDQIYIVDSLPTIKKGVYRFKGRKPLTPGQYLFIKDNRRLFHFLLSFEQYTKLSFTATLNGERITEVEVMGDKENKAYFEMQRFLQQINQKPQLTQIDVERIERYTDSIAALYPHTVLAIIARNIANPPLPEFMALHDPRVLHTSILPVRLKNLFTHIVPPQPDMVIPQVDRILELSSDPLVRAYCGEFLLHYFLSSPIMGMENVAVHIAKKYVTGELKSTNEELLLRLSSYVAFNESSLIGKQAPELNLSNREGNLVSLKDIEANYTILLFYDEDCTACKEQIPLINQVYKEYQSKGVAVYAVYTQDRREAWLKYIETNLSPEWMHVWDPEALSRFHKLYNVTGTPRIFLLDRNKTIIGREIDASILAQILSHQP